MSDIKVVCTSDKNVSLTFTWDDFTPFHLVDIEGIYGIESNVVQARTQPRTAAPTREPPQRKETLSLPWKWIAITKKTETFYTAHFQ